MFNDLLDEIRNNEELSKDVTETAIRVDMALLRENKKVLN